MSNFKLSWRIAPAIYTDEEKWQSFLRLIDSYDGVCDEAAFYIVDDTFPELSPIEDKLRQTEICKKRFEELRRRGKTVGINVWPTLPLYEVEQRYFPDMPRMVGIDGNEIKNLPCPVSSEFLSFISENFTVFARSGPDFIWVDDDCRFTHLGGKYPCFCKGCVKGFKGGEFSSREELTSALSKPENRELRVCWSAYGADRLATLCGAIRAAVDKVDENIDIGLMTIGATHTTFSGDYIKKCMRALRSKRGRPGHDLYSDRLPDKLMWKALEVGRQVYRYPETVTDTMWEEDSCPQGHLAKSFKTRQNEISLGLMMGCSGAAFNHLGLNGMIDKRLGREAFELHSNRPRWEKFLEFSAGLPLGGMWPIYSRFMTAKADPDYAWLKEKPMPENQNPDVDITTPEKIGPFGIPLTPNRKGSCATLISGKTITAFSEAELKEVFSGNVYMDGSALEALEAMGLGHLAGVSCKVSELPTKLCHFTEHPFIGAFAGQCYRTLPKKSYTLSSVCDGVEWLGYRKEVYGEGDRYYISKFENALGGKVIVNGFEAWQSGDNPSNLFLLSSVAEWFGSPLRIKWEDPNCVSRVQPYIRTDGSRAAVMLLNASLDTTDPFEIIVKGEMSKASLLLSDGSETGLNCKTEDGFTYAAVPEIWPFDLAYILLN
ncbi:MAG: hypothetical protein IJW27_02670 [Clostridia bacterium]|nr:hypothetical protein [Clostridia bacterium]